MHDASYKLLFSHAEMIKDLLQGFVPQSWVQALDFSTLENLYAGHDPAECARYLIPLAENGSTGP